MDSGVQRLFDLFATFSSHFGKILEAWEACGSNNACKIRELTEYVTLWVGLAHPALSLSRIVEKGLNAIWRRNHDQALIQRGSTRERIALVASYAFVEIVFGYFLNWVRYSTECLTHDYCEEAGDAVIWIKNMKIRYCSVDPNEDEENTMDCDEEANCEENPENSENMCETFFNQLPIIVFTGFVWLLATVSYYLNIDIGDGDGSPPPAPPEPTDKKDNPPSPPPNNPDKPQPPPPPPKPDSPKPSPPDDPKPAPQPPNKPEKPKPTSPAPKSPDKPKPTSPPPNNPDNPKPAPAPPNNPDKPPPPPPPSDNPKPSPQPPKDKPSPKPHPKDSSKGKRRPKRSGSCGAGPFQEIEVQCPLCKRDYITRLPDPLDIYCCNCGSGDDPKPKSPPKSQDNSTEKKEDKETADTTTSTDTSPGPSFVARPGLLDRNEVEVIPETHHHELSGAHSADCQDLWISDESSESSEEDEEELYQFGLEFVKEHKEELLQSLNPYCPTCGFNHSNHFHVFEEMEVHENGCNAEQLLEEE